MDRLHFTAAFMGLAILVASGAASSQTISYSVDCSTGHSIASALRRGDARKPLLIHIKGTCSEFVAIERDNVTLVGEPGLGATIEAPDTSSDAVSISGSGITLDNLTLTGGNYGIRNNHGVRVLVRNCVIQDTASTGIHSWVGDVRVQQSTIRHAGGNGLRVVRAGSLAISNSQVLDNSGDGIYVHQNGTVSANGNTIRGNRANGVTLHSGSHGDFSGNEISANEETGLLVQVGSTANIDNNTVSRNQGDGIIGYLGATLVLHDNEVSQNQGSGVVGNAHSTIQMGGAHINANYGDGIVMALGSKLILEEPSTEVFGNGGSALWCGDNESSVNDLGLLSWTGNVECTGF
jgi:hypothetical protein